MKPKKCKAKSCGIAFEPKRMGQHACSPLCAVELARAKREQAETRARSDARKADRQKREKLKTVRDWIKDAQTAFNRYVRLRDAGKPCICCGMPLALDGVGGGYDCGHFRSTGSASHLRFHPDNAHGQRKVCNRYGAGRAVDYRRGLIERIGVDRVEALENDNTPRKWSIDELKAIRDHYREEAKRLESA